MIPGQLERMKEVYSGRAQIGAKLETPIRLRPKIGRVRYELGFLLRRIGATLSRLGFYLSFGPLTCSTDAALGPKPTSETADEARSDAAYGATRWLKRALGEPGVRDHENPCDMFSPGKPTHGGCQGDGHYLCHECSLFDDRTMEAP